MDQGSAHRSAGLNEAQIRVGDDRRPPHRVAEQVLVATERVGGSVIFVSAALGHRVDVRAGKPALAHIEGGDRDLHLRDRVVRNRLGIGLSARRRVVEAEGIVEVRPVQRDVVVQPVSTREAVVAVVAWVHPNQVARAALDRGQQRDLLRIDERRRAGAPRVEHRVTLSGRFDGLQLDRLGLETEIDAQVLPEAQEDAVLGVGFVPDAGSRHPVRPADSHVGDVIRSPCPRDGSVLRAAGNVHRHDRRISQRGSVLGGDDAAHRRCSHALRGQHRRDAQQREQHQHAPGLEQQTGGLHAILPCSG